MSDVRITAGCVADSAAWPTVRVDHRHLGGLSAMNIRTSPHVQAAGGDFGVDGSVGATLVLAVACLESYGYYTRVEATREAVVPAPETAA